MHVQAGTAAGVGLGDDERERFEAVPVAVQPVRELARDPVKVAQLVEREEQVGGVVRFLRRA